MALKHWMVGWAAVLLLSGGRLASAAGEAAPVTGGGVSVVVSEGRVETEGAGATGGAVGGGGGEIRRTRSAGGASGSGVSAGGSGGAMGEIVRLGMGLAVVLGVILAMRYGAAKWLGLKGAGPMGNKGVRVLSRTLMGPRQQLVLLQVGRRLVLVCDSAGRVSAVTEVTDPDEVAELTAQAMGEEVRSGVSSGAGAFAGLLGLKSLGFAGREESLERELEELVEGERGQAVERGVVAERDAVVESAEAGSAESGLSMLAERVRGLSARMAGGVSGGDRV